MSSSKGDTAITQLYGRKHKAKMGANLNESVATGPSNFARKQLESMGWTEGTGLGKNRDGRSEHIRVTKRTDGQALGAASVQIDPTVTGDQWWKSSVGNTLAKLAAKNKKKKKDKKKTKKRKLEYTDEELFQATGGARFGMRAQTQQKGKWNRAEDAITKDQEQEAKSKTEWDGMKAPKIVLSEETTKKKSKSKSKGKLSSSSESSSSSKSSDSEVKLPKKKKQKRSENDTKENNTNDNTKTKKKEKKEKKSKKDKKSKKEKKKKEH